MSMYPGMKGPAPGTGGVSGLPLPPNMFSSDLENQNKVSNMPVLSEPYPQPSPGLYAPGSGPGDQALGQPPNTQTGMWQRPQVGPSSIYDVYASAIPVMEQTRDRNIFESLANFGSTGNRFGTAAINNVAQIGANTALQQNQMLTDLLYRQGQSDADRTLQATGQGINLASTYDQMQRNRMDELMKWGGWEQGRADQFQQLPYGDWSQNKLGFLPMLLGALSGQMPQQQTPISTSTGAVPGAVDYATTAAMIAAMFYGASDEILKTNITRHSTGPIPEVPWASWKWKDSGLPSFGVIAQDLEKVRPDLVYDIGGIKHVDYRGLMEVA